MLCQNSQTEVSPIQSLGGSFTLTIKSPTLEMVAYNMFLFQHFLLSLCPLCSNTIIVSALIVFIGAPFLFSIELRLCWDIFQRSLPIKSAVRIFSSSKFLYHFLGKGRTGISIFIIVFILFF